MKKLLLFSIAVLLFCHGFSKAQTIPITSGVACSNCVPNGWTKTSGSPSISNSIAEGGNVNLQWTHNVSPPPSGQSTFISLYNTTASKDAVSTKITGLTAGVKYHLTYNVMSAASAKSQNEFGTSAKIRLAMGGQIPYTVAEKTLTFEDFNAGSWQQQILPFTAAADYIDLHFTGTAGSKGGFVFLDIKADAVSNTCLNISQVPLTSNSIANECPVKTVDLTSLLSGNPPPGAVVQWYTNAQHTGAPVAKPTEAVAPGDYYAFYYKASEDCFNTNQSTAKVTTSRNFCCGQEGYIQLSQSEVTIACPEKTVNLNSLVITPPPGPGFKLVWFTHPIYTIDPPIADPTKASGGIGAPIIYYAFYYNEALDCYNVAVSNAVVLVTGCCAAGDSQIILNSGTITNTCPTKTVNLNSLYSGNIPATSSLKWFNNPTHTGNAVADPTKVSVAGDYYAFIWDEFNNCYNTDNSTAKATVTLIECACITGTDQVPVLANLSNICPEATVNLASAFTGSVPNATELVWFTTANHAPGSKIANPNIISNPGAYYAFFYDPVNDCYNTDNSTAKTDVTVNVCPPPCNAGSAQVPVLSTISNSCPSATVDLGDTFSGNVPDWTALIWYTTPNHAAGTKVPNNGDFVSVSGIYYAFYYDAANNCFNTANSTAAVTVNIHLCAQCKAGTNQVQLKRNTIKNACPVTTANLNTMLSGSAPVGSTLVWFKNSLHEFNAVADPTKAGAGDYYAFFYDAVNNCYNTNLSTSMVTVTVDVCPCNAGTDQLTVAPTMANACPAEKVNLNDGLINYVPIIGTAVRWFTTSNHAPLTEVPNAGAAGAGTYYAFLYDFDGDCYNTAASTAKTVVTIAACCKAGTAQVPLSQTAFTLRCVSEKVNLNALVASIPNGAELYWFTNTTHTPPIVMNPTAVGAGTYYAYFYDPVNLCYNTDLSTAQVIVTGPQQVPLSASTLTNVCPVETVNINSLMIGSAPNNMDLVWYTTANHSGNQVLSTDQLILSGTYYAFFKDKTTNCFNTDLSTAKVTVNMTFCYQCNVGDGNVQLAGNSLNNVCPMNTVDLTSLVLGNLPNVLWFDNNTHSGLAVVNPAEVANSGIYYAFLYDAVNDCYNTDLSEADVVVTINPCVPVPATLDLKVKLQGAMSPTGISMRTDLQNYLGENIGLLPTIDPYGFGKTYMDINNISGDAGKVVDWVLVEIRNAAQPSMVLQSKVLLLRLNGDVVETDGTKPVFQPESDAVQIVIKHRNHIAIMSNPIASFNGDISYDFTTDLSKAFNPPSPDNPGASIAPAQMVLVNGVWCMWAGDIDQNLALNPGDYNTILSANGGQQGEIYMNTDINMDGGMDETDMNLIFSNNLVEPYSILSIF